MVGQQHELARTGVEQLQAPRLRVGDGHGSGDDRVEEGLGVRLCNKAHAEIAQQLRVTKIAGHGLFGQRVLEACEQPIRKLAEQAHLVVAPAVRTRIADREDELPLAVADERYGHEGSHLQALVCGGVRPRVAVGVVHDQDMAGTGGLAILGSHEVRDADNLRPVRGSLAVPDVQHTDLIVGLVHTEQAHRRHAQMRTDEGPGDPHDVVG